MTTILSDNGQYLFFKIAVNETKQTFGAGSLE